MKTTCLLASFVAACLLFTTGCNSKGHPNQLNAFDGSTYDTMTAAHSALLTLRAQVVTSYPKYTAEFNLAATAYNTALTSYAAFRLAPAQDQTVLAAEVGNITVSIVALENAIQADLHVPPAKVNEVRARARSIRAQAGQFHSNMSFQDVMTELELAAAIAQAVPGTQPYSTLAALVIQATNTAVTALEAQTGKPIDLTSIPAIPAIA